MTNHKETLLIPAVTALVSCGIFAFGMMQPEGQAFEFPNLFVGAMIFFSLVWLIGEAVLHHKPVLEAIAWKEVLGGVGLICLYLLIVNWLGFALSSILVFFAIGFGYSIDRKGIRTPVVSAISAVAFIAVIYCIFNLVLKVQTPEGLL